MDDLVDRHGCGVDAGRGHQFIAGSEVCRRKSQLASAAGSSRNRSIDKVVMAQKRPSLIHSTLTEQPPHSRAADDEVFVSDWIDLLGAEPVSSPERSQDAEGATSLVTEHKICAHPH